MLEMENTQVFKQGVIVASDQRDFVEAIRAAVDYRGDVTIRLKDGSSVEGFLYNSENNILDLFPKNSPQKRSLTVDEVQEINFSGADEAAGKSWEDWVKKRESQKVKSKEN